MKDVLSLLLSRMAYLSQKRLEQRCLADAVVALAAQAPESAQHSSLQLSPLLSEQQLPPSLLAPFSSPTKLVGSVVG